MLISLAEMAIEAGQELAAVYEQPDAAVVTQDREGQRQRRVRHVAAADIEQPSDQLGHCQHGGGDFRAGETAGQPGALVRSALTGKAVGMRHYGGERGCRPSRPDPVHRIAFNCAQARPGALGADLQPFDLLRRVQPGVVAEHGTLAER